jgi:hypothetical protein
MLRRSRTMDALASLVVFEKDAKARRLSLVGDLT